MAKTICDCCDDSVHEPDDRNPNFTWGEIFFLVNIMAGGFNMVYVDEINTHSSQCKRENIKKFLDLGIIEAGESVYHFTKKGIEFYNKYIH